MPTDSETKFSHRQYNVPRKVPATSVRCYLARPVSSREQTINVRLAAGFRNLWWQIPCSVSCMMLIKGRGPRTRDTNPCRVGVIDGAEDSDLFDVLVWCTCQLHCKLHDCMYILPCISDVHISHNVWCVLFSGTGCISLKNLRTLKHENFVCILWTIF